MMSSQVDGIKNMIGRTVSGIPLDLQVLHDFYRNLSGNALEAAAHILDAERSGLDLRSMTVAAIETIRRNYDLESKDSVYFLEDMLSMLPIWRIEGVAVREPLVDIFTHVCKHGSSEEDMLNWMDTFASLDREGYTMKWVAQKIAVHYAIEWNDVLKFANGLIDARIQKLNDERKN